MNDKIRGPLVKLVITLACHAGIRSSSLLRTANLGVAQSGSASALGAEGRRFESYHRDQIFNFKCEIKWNDQLVLIVDVILHVLIRVDGIGLSVRDVIKQDMEKELIKKVLRQLGKLSVIMRMVV